MDEVLGDLTPCPPLLDKERGSFIIKEGLTPLLNTHRRKFYTTSIRILG